MVLYNAVNMTFSAFFGNIFFVFRVVLDRIFTMLSELSNKGLNDGTGSYIFLLAFPFFAIFGFTILYRVFGFLRGGN